MPTIPMLSLDRAVVTRHDDGLVQIDDPEAPLVVSLRVVCDPGGRSRLETLVVESRAGAGITSKALTRLPLPMLTHVATLQQAAPHANELHWRSLVRPKPYGARDWPPEHWALVLDVFRWAVESGRAGGGYQAIADLWCVARRPTAYRWVSHAHQVVTEPANNISGSMNAAGQRG